MASWKKHLTHVNLDAKLRLSQSANKRSNGMIVPGEKFASYLPEVYAGQPQRRERYQQYDIMDGDSEINASLDTIAEFSTQTEEHNPTPFYLEYDNDITEAEVTTAGAALKTWNKRNEFDKRIFTIFRNTIKYGDQVFIRDPETCELLWVDISKVNSVIVNQAEGKKPETYVINDLDLNLQTLVATTTPPAYQQTTGLTARSPGPITYSYPRTDQTTSHISNNSSNNNGYVAAEHVVHLSLSDGMDNNWPFGNSILESVFKIFKQKELLEDAIIIYRIQRAPERRIFYVDVGDMPPQKAHAVIEKMKNDINQRRIPNRTGGGSSIIDSTYNPMCLDLSTRIPLLDGRTLPLNDIIDEVNAGKKLWVYSCNPETGEVVPGPISAAAITRRNAEVMKLTFDNGKELICTPDHKIPVWGKGFVEAKDITIDDDIIPAKFQEHLHMKGFFNKTGDLKYTIGSYPIYDINKKEWVKVDLTSNGDYILVQTFDTLYRVPTLVKTTSKIHLEETMDTGCITVNDKDGYHTFAIEAGIFVKNSMLEDYYIAQSSTGRGSKVETLPGGESLGAIEDLLYFDNKLKRGLRVPSSYLPGGAEDGASTYTDGRVGTAYIQEHRFALYCRRLQESISSVLDKEFKYFLKKNGYNIDTSLFELKFNPPQGFGKYRQIELDSSQISIFTQLMGVPYLSKRFLLDRYLNLTKEEIKLNEVLWMEEQADNAGADGDIEGGMGGGGGDMANLGSLGIRPPGDDMGDMDDLEGLDDGGDLGGAGDLGGDTGGADLGGDTGAGGPTGAPPTAQGV